jgi:hypothetical protein
MDVPYFSTNRLRRPQSYRRQGEAVTPRPVNFLKEPKPPSQRHHAAVTG